MKSSKRTATTTSKTPVNAGLAAIAQRNARRAAAKQTAAVVAPVLGPKAQAVDVASVVAANNARVVAAMKSVGVKVGQALDAPTAAKLSKAVKGAMSADAHNALLSEHHRASHGPASLVNKASQATSAPAPVVAPPVVKAPRVHAPCTVCGRQNTDGRNCRTASACAKRVAANVAAAAPAPAEKKRAAKK
jgi:hypothetical protein